jgi:hypothetical protein
MITLEKLQFVDLSAFSQKIGTIEGLSTTVENNRIAAETGIANTITAVGNDLLAANGAQKLVTDAIKAGMTNLATITALAENDIVVGINAGLLSVNEALALKADGLAVSAQIQTVQTSLADKASVVDLTALEGRVTASETDIITVVQDANENFVNIRTTFASLFPVVPPAEGPILTPQ